MSETSVAFRQSVPRKDNGEDDSCLESTKHYIKKRIPIVDWLPKYKWRKYFLRDFTCGFTLACIHVPQALAFSMLANVDLVYGLYTTCLTGIVYAIFGTAHISSFGPVAIGSMITGEAVQIASGHGFSNNEVATSVTFLIGIIYLVGFMLRFGIFTLVFRKYFISAFVAGCTFHILGKSLKMLLGIKLKSRYGLFNFPLNVYDLFVHIGETNYWTLCISVCVLIVFIFNMIVLKPLVRKCMKFVIPIEAITMLAVGLISYLWDFKEKGVPVVGYVPSGFPTPIAPNFEVFGLIWASALTTAVINYSSSTSMTMIYNKDMRPDQEMLAMAITNLICANFQCITVGNSMMRTRVAVTLNLKTLMSTIVASGLMIFVILFVGPIFTPMPLAVLGCIIVLSTTLLLLDRAKEVIPICSKSWEEAFIYIVTLGVTLSADVAFGLLVGGLLSLRKVLTEIPEAPEVPQPTEKNGHLPEVEKLLDEKNQTPIIVSQKNTKLSV